MALPDQLRERTSAIADRWLQETLATYPEDSAAAFRREKDPFANPVGRTLRVGTRAVLEALLEGKDSDEICSYLDDIMKIRVVQEFTPSQAVSFVFLLKEAVRAELGENDPAPLSACELAGLEKQIDQIALGTFDIYMRYREQVCELRVNEVKRSVAKIVERSNRHSSSFPKLDENSLSPKSSNRADAQRGGG